jgi:hypothetical protein
LAVRAETERRPLWGVLLPRMPRKSRFERKMLNCKIWKEEEVPAHI